MPERTPPPLEQLRAYADGFNASLPLRTFGLTMEFPQEGTRVLARLNVRPDHRGGLGTSAVNGAVLAGMFDVAIGCTGALIDPTRRTATAQLSMSFEHPVHGETISAEAWIDRAGTSMIFASAVIRDGAGEICARCQGVVRLSRLPWLDGGSPRAD